MKVIITFENDAESRTEGPFEWIEMIDSIIAGCRVDGQEAEEIAGLNTDGSWHLGGPVRYRRWTVSVTQ